jgi:hypothetical protein
MMYTLIIRCYCGPRPAGKVSVMICNTGAAKLNTATTLNTLNATNPALRAFENVSDSIASFSGPGGGGGRSKPSIVSLSSPFTDPTATTPMMLFLLTRFRSFNGVVVFIAFVSFNFRSRQDAITTTTDGLLLLVLSDDDDDDEEEEEEEEEHEQEHEEETKLAVVLAMKAALVDVVWIASMCVRVCLSSLPLLDWICEEKISHSPLGKKMIKKNFRIRAREENGPSCRRVRRSKRDARTRRGAFSLALPLSFFLFCAVSFCVSSSFLLLLLLRQRTEFARGNGKERALTLADEEEEPLFLFSPKGGLSEENDARE